MSLRELHAAEIEKTLSQYASKRSAVLPLLYIAQDSYGHLSAEAIREVAAILDLPPTDVFEVVGFYTLFYGRPVGTWVLQVCDDVPCCYCGAEELVAALKQKLGVQEEETTPDGMFTLQRVKCLAACDRAPLLQANLDYIYDVTPERVDELLRSLRERAAGGEALSVSGRQAEDYEWTPAGQLRRIERNLGAIPDRVPMIEPTKPAEPRKAAEPEPVTPAKLALAAAAYRSSTEAPTVRSPAGAQPRPEQQAEQGAVPAPPAETEQARRGERGGESSAEAQAPEVEQSPERRTTGQ